MFDFFKADFQRILSAFFLGFFLFRKYWKFGFVMQLVMNGSTKLQSFVYYFVENSYTKMSSEILRHNKVEMNAALKHLKKKKINFGLLYTILKSWNCLLFDGKAKIRVDDNCYQ